jgi:Putative Ig domain
MGNFVFTLVFFSLLPSPSLGVAVVLKSGIHGPKIYGARPGNPFLYAIPATGRHPISFSAKGLPAGLKLDSQTGRITGLIAKRGRYRVKLCAKNAKGEDQRDLRIVAGDTLALTPPLGWSTWYMADEETSVTRWSTLRPTPWFQAV